MLPSDHIAITLFEDQLIRNYFSGGRDCLFYRIVQKKRVTVFTSREHQALVNKYVKDLRITNASVCVFDSTRGGFLYKFFSFLLRWSLGSGTVFVTIQRDKSFKFIPRRVVFSFAEIFPRARHLIRFLFSCCLPKRKLAKRFQLSATELTSIESVFVSSLTNLYEDVSVAIYFRHCGRRVIGTVRSWDNLTSHGALHFVPDEFFTHSPWINQAALEFQKLRAAVLKPWVSPSHQDLFLGNPMNRQDKKDSNKVRVLYASMGLETNPDDQNMIDWICQVWPKLPQQFELTILQHPQFILWPQQSSARTSVVRFDYSSSQLKDYYEFIQSHDLVIGAGTSVILDATFVEIPIVLTKFEVVSQSYWKSHLRYFDYLDHTKTLFSLGDFTIVESQSQLLSTILNQNYKLPKHTARDFFVWSDSQNV